MKIYHSKFRTLETIKWRHILFPRPSWPVRFNSSDIHRPVSTKDFEFITKLNSHQMIKSRLSPVWAMLDARLTSGQNIVRDYRLLQVNDLVSVLRCSTNERAEHRERLSSATGKRFGFRTSHFFSMKSYSLQIP